MITKEFLKVKLTDLIPYANNPRDNEEAARDAYCDALRIASERSNK